MKVGTPNNGYLVVDSVVALDGDYRNKAAGWLANKEDAFSLAQLLAEKGDYLVIDAETGKVIG